MKYMKTNISSGLGALVLACVVSGSLWAQTPSGALAEGTTNIDSPRPPNIVFILTDDQRLDTIERGSVFWKNHGS